MTERNDALLPLASTAFWTASARAQESAREDCLFNDPWAAALAGEEGAAWLVKAGSVAPMVIRTRYFDDCLRRVTGGQLRQVVIVAAGLDTRAYRLDWPEGTRLFELDLPDILRYKEQVLALKGARPRCERTAIPADLTAPWGGALTAAGFDPARPAAWLLEGFLFYLPNTAAAQILDTVSDLAAPGSWIGFDIVNQVTLTSPYTRAWITMQAAAGAPWIGYMDDPEQALAERGWLAAMTQPGAPDAHYGRWTLPVYPVKMPDLPHNWYVTGEKK